MGKVAANYVIG